MSGPLFYLGAHMPHWLWTVAFPLFVSHRQLARKARLRPAVCRWALDSGGFTELSLYGRWVTSPAQYAEAGAHYAATLGMPDFLSQQDWMCELFMVERTGLSVREHQHRTVAFTDLLRALFLVLAPVGSARPGELYRPARTLSLCPEE